METLPSFEECEKAVNNGSANKLQIVIFENEPAGNEELKFRSQLLEVINEVTATSDVNYGNKSLDAPRIKL